MNQNQLDNTTSPRSVEQQACSAPVDWQTVSVAGMVVAMCGVLFSLAGDQLNDSCGVGCALMLAASIGQMIADRKAKAQNK